MSWFTFLLPCRSAVQRNRQRCEISAATLRSWLRYAANARYSLQLMLTDFNPRAAQNLLMYSKWLPTNTKLTIPWLCQSARALVNIAEADSPRAECQQKEISLVLNALLKRLDAAIAWQTAELERLNAKIVADELNDLDEQIVGKR